MSSETGGATVGASTARDRTFEPFEPGVPLPPIDGLVFRRLVRPADYPAMNRVANAIRAADGHPFITSDSDMAAFYEHLTESDVARDVLVVDVGGETIGYGRVGHAMLDNGLPLYEIVLVLEPDRLGSGIEEAMLAALENRGRDVAAELGRPGLGVFGTDAETSASWRIALLEAAGYRPVRYGFWMVRPTLDDVPDAPLPEGLEIRDVRPEHLRAIWEAEVEAFRDHWGARQPVEGDFEAWCADEMQGDTTLWRVAWDGEQVAGMVRGYVNAEENRTYGRQRGWVENISVRRPWRRRGLARALIAATIPLLRARGMTEGALGVDSENPNGALQLYESVGFQRSGGDVTYEKPLAEG